jgi:hypothetical protein
MTLAKGKLLSYSPSDLTLLAPTSRFFPFLSPYPLLFTSRRKIIRQETCTGEFSLIRFSYSTHPSVLVLSGMSASQPEEFVGASMDDVSSEIDP